MTLNRILCSSGISRRHWWLGYDLWQHRVLQITFWRSRFVLSDNKSPFSCSKFLVANSSLLLWTLIPLNLGLKGVADHIYSWSWYNSTFIYPIFKHVGEWWKSLLLLRQRAKIANSAGKLEGRKLCKVDPKGWINREKVEYTFKDGGYPLDCL